ncbi:MAG TPA: tripartite tricarboxylate transporter substrate binding protein [Alphaproteobacteria bacterium]|jgi:tripartite-type tricarboxylate transporter receptor subunit TctC|nr:tripartite tricarboxylate transporter substrate binding protein [Alphaproteobacteria bacterium]
MRGTGTVTRGLVLAIGLAALGGTAAAEGYPSRAVEVVTPFNAGSTVDLLLRAFADGMSKSLKGTFVVINRPGASGTIAISSVATAKPDGYTLAFGPNGQVAIQTHLHKDLPYKGPESFEFICQAWENPFVIAVAQNSPYKSLKDIFDAAKKAPGKLSWGDIGVATVPNLQMLILAQAAGVTMTHVPYRTYPEMILNAKNNLLDFIVPSPGSIIGQDLRVVAIVGDKRLDRFPGVPTVGELGFPELLPGFGGLYAPKGIPADARQKLEAACVDATKTEEWKKVVERTDSTLAFLPGAEFAKRMAANTQQFGEVLKKLDIKPQ